jgi:folate-binding protein YgfZ
MVAVFSDASAELSALLSGAAVFDQGARARLRITGQDRVRWLNGMVTNTVKALPPGAHNYTFVLNAQGRIQGDASVFAFPDHLILETDREQAERLYAHLDRFIIMDDVELRWVEEQTTLGVAGPGAEALLAALGLPTPEAGLFATGADPEVTVVGEYSPSVRRFSLWVGDTDRAGDRGAPSLWARLLRAGAVPAGELAVDALRVLEATPLYGVDISDKTLAQETGQVRALNFSKGCYLGQEIVERVRSLAKVHRGIRQFALAPQALGDPSGDPVAPGTPLTSDGSVVGELTSVARVTPPGVHGQIALGIVRIEALGRPLLYAGGSASVLPAPPLAIPEPGIR